MQQPHRTTTTYSVTVARSKQSETHEVFPFTAKSLLDSGSSCNQNIRLPCLDFLNRADIQIRLFCQFFLC